MHAWYPAAVSTCSSDVYPARNSLEGYGGSAAMMFSLVRVGLFMFVWLVDYIEYDQYDYDDKAYDVVVTGHTSLVVIG